MKKLIIIILLSMLASTFTLIGIMYHNPKIEMIEVRDTLVVSPPTALDLERSIFEVLVANGCVLPNVALAQFKIESAHFSSDIFKENNNCAGIRTSRSDLVIGMNRGHCVYATLEDCILDYIAIQNNYLVAIDGKYAESSEYLDLIRKVR